jgi:hypothetical protein
MRKSFLQEERRRAESEEFFTGGKRSNREWILDSGFCEIGDLLGWSEEEFFTGGKGGNRGWIGIDFIEVNKN